MASNDQFAADSYSINTPSSGSQDGPRYFSSPLYTHTSLIHHCRNFTCSLFGQSEYAAIDFCGTSSRCREYADADADAGLHLPRVAVASKKKKKTYWILMRTRQRCQSTSNVWLCFDSFGCYNLSTVPLDGYVCFPSVCRRRNCPTLDSVPHEINALPAVPVASTRRGVAPCASIPRRRTHRLRTMLISVGCDTLMSYVYSFIHSFIHKWVTWMHMSYQNTDVQFHVGLFVACTRKSSMHLVKHKKSRTQCRYWTWHVSLRS